MIDDDVITKVQKGRFRRKDVKSSAILMRKAYGLMSIFLPILILQSTPYAMPWMTEIAVKLAHS